MKDQVEEKTELQEMGNMLYASTPEDVDRILSIADKITEIATGGSAVGEVKAEEKQIVKEFQKMCESSLEPDKYSFLMDEILPALVNTRKALKESNIDWDDVEEIDGKLHLNAGIGHGLRLLTDEEAADYIWGASLLTPPISVEDATGESNPVSVSGMYGDTPKVVVGKISICEMDSPPGEHVWMERILDDGEIDGASFNKSNLEDTLANFYDSNF